ncbi:MAG: clan AA aspartic protease [Rhodocyclaceae bacterium]|nr:clan AA aspartic protease [Rhodocyclaceae bacterium]
MKRKIPGNVLVPFRVERSRHITVIATLAGKDARFLVDTGAGGTCIDSSALERFGIGLSKRSSRGGGVGNADMQLTRVAKHDLSVAELNLSKLRLHALDLSHVNAGLKAAKVKEIVGVLGADILLERNATIDYSRRCIILADVLRDDA